LKILSKETSLDSNDAAVPEKQLLSPWTCKPWEKKHRTLKINIQKFASGFFGAKVLRNKKQIF